MRISPALAAIWLSCGGQLRHNATRSPAECEVEDDMADFH
jgi:hypothetical protein